MGNFGDGDKIKLAPAQVYWAAELYGRRLPDDPRRRLYKEFYLVVPRKAGKSTFGAAMCLRELCDPTRRGPLAQCMGKTKEHAWHVFDRARKMVAASEDFRKKYNMKESGSLIHRTDHSGARMIVETGNVKDGSSPVIVTVDELHDMPNPRPIEVARSSLAATYNPMVAKFTTAGYLPMSLGLDEREQSIQNFKGTITLPRQLSLLYEWDEDIGLEDDDPRLWEAVHPLYHHTVEPDFYPDAWQKGKVNAKSLEEFNHKLLCKWMRGDQSYCVSEEQWDALPPAPKLDRKILQRAWLGIDTAQLHDLMSITLLGQLHDESLAAWWWIYAPRSKIGETVSSNTSKDVLTTKAINEWISDGHIRTSGDIAVDFQEMADKIANLIRNYPVDLAMVDQHSGNEQIHAFLPDACKPKMMRLFKSPLNTTAPMQQLLPLIREKRLAVDKNPVARWGVTNAVMEARTGGTLFPKKVTEWSAAHIDPFDSLLWAVAGRQIYMGGTYKRKKDAPIPLRNAEFGGRIRAL